MGEEKNWNFFSSPIPNHRVKKGLPAQKKWGMTHISLLAPLGVGKRWRDGLTGRSGMRVQFFGDGDMSNNWQKNSTMVPKRAIN
jgi:hypothetical protein